MPENSPKSLSTKCLIGGFRVLCGWVLVGWFLCGFWVRFGISCGGSFAFLLYFVLGFGLLLLSFIFIRFIFWGKGFGSFFLVFHLGLGVFSCFRVFGFGSLDFGGNCFLLFLFIVILRFCLLRGALCSFFFCGYFYLVWKGQVLFILGWVFCLWVWFPCWPLIVIFAVWSLKLCENCWI